MVTETGSITAASSATQHRRPTRTHAVTRAKRLSRSRRRPVPERVWRRQDGELSGADVENSRVRSTALVCSRNLARYIRFVPEAEFGSPQRLGPPCARTAPNSFLTTPGARHRWSRSASQIRPRHRSISRSRKTAHLSNCSSSIHSSALCACSIEPGPTITVGMPAIS